MTSSSGSAYSFPFGLVTSLAQGVMGAMPAQGQQVNLQSVPDTTNRRAAREAVREAERTVAATQADQREASVWWTFNDGSSSSVKLVDGWTKTAEKKERRIRDVIARDEKLALIRLRGPVNRDDVRLMLDVIENGAEYPDDVAELLGHDQLAGNRQEGLFVRGPFSQRAAMRSNQQLRGGSYYAATHNQLPFHTGGPPPPGTFDVWEAFVGALDA